MPGRLVARGAQEAGTIPHLVAETSGIGRAAASTVVVGCHGISRRHDEVRWDRHADVLTLANLAEPTSVLDSGERTVTAGTATAS
jgi:hypothetical protein